MKGSSLCQKVLNEVLNALKIIMKLQDFGTFSTEMSGWFNLRQMSQDGFSRHSIFGDGVMNIRFNILNVTFHQLIDSILRYAVVYH